MSSCGHMVVNVYKSDIFVYTFLNGVSSDYINLRPLKTSAYLQQVDRWSKNRCG